MKSIVCLLIGLSLITFSHSLSGTANCTVDNLAKVDCGNSRTSQAQCEAAGCCWEAVRVSGQNIPWCYFAEAVEEETEYDVTSCQVADADRTDCGFSTITQAQCLARGCCWKSSSTRNIPWCFYPEEIVEPRVPTPTVLVPDPVCPVLNAFKEDCGADGVNQATCELRGCCWKSSNVARVPWCFYAIDRECDIEDDSKLIDCGYSGIGEAGCLERDCCWANRGQNSLQPWCYQKASFEKNADCIIPRGAMKFWCKPRGTSVTKSQCFNLGCCWEVSTDPDIPTCYYFAKPHIPDIDTRPACQYDDELRADRKCGGDYIDKETCIDLGCCWSETTNPKAPFCYTMLGQ